MPDEVAMILVMLCFTNTHVFLCCVYIPSGSPVPVYQNYVDALERTFCEIGYETNDLLCFLGDFNLTHINWAYDSNIYIIEPSSIDSGNFLIPSGTGCSVKAELLNLFFSYGLRQVNDNRNYQCSILDLVFTSGLDDIIFSKAPSMSGVDIYHDPIEVSIPVVSSRIFESEQTNNYEFNFRNADYPALNYYFQSIDWEGLLTNNEDINENVDDVVERFYEVLLAGFKSCVQLKI